jgi:hypothetical protein
VAAKLAELPCVARGLAKLRNIKLLGDILRPVSGAGWQVSAPGVGSLVLCFEEDQQQEQGARSKEPEAGSDAGSSFSSANPESQTPNPDPAPNPEPVSTVCESRTPNPEPRLDPPEPVSAVGESQTPNPEPRLDPRPKAEAKRRRHYRTSPEGREAKRRSMEKVREATPKEVLQRITPKRRTASSKNLGLAREGKRRKREQGKSTGIHHGLSCVDLRGSLAMAGATPEELEAHRQAFLDCLKPRDKTESKLARGMADCLWRREQVVHVQAVEYTLGLKARMIVAAEPDQAWLGEVAVARLAIDVFNKAPDLSERLTKLNGRFGRLAWLFLAQRDEEEGFAPKLRWNEYNCHMINWSAEAMGNPFVTPGQVAQALLAKLKEMKPASEWNWQGAEGRKAARVERIKEQMLREYQTDVHPILRHQAEPITDLLKRGGSAVLVMDGGKTEVKLGEGEPQQVLYLSGGTAQVAAGIAGSDWPEWREKEVEAALRQEYLRTSVALRGKGTVGGVSRADFLQVFAAAFAPAGSAGPVDDVTGPSSFVTCEEPARGEPVTKDKGPVTSSSNGLALPGDEKRIRAAANAAWEMVKGFEEQARKDQEQVKAILAEAGLSARQRLERILGLISDVEEIVLSACERLAKLQQKLCALIGGRPGAWDSEAAHCQKGLGRDGSSLGLADLSPNPIWIDPKLRKQFREDLRLSG